MNNADLFWNSTIKELKKGFIKKNKKYFCIFCGKEFNNNLIYKINENFYDSNFAVKNHIKENHISSFDYLINIDKKYNGLSDIQKTVINGMYNNIPDNEIAKKLNNVANSTIRNHKFILREKYKEAKLFIAIMELMNKKDKMDDKFINFHNDIPINDGRIITTENEKQEILNKYFNSDFTKLKKIPKKEKEKLVILQQILKNFNCDKKYSEIELNAILKPIVEDFASIRRFLIDYHFMARKPDCSEYWVK